MRHFVGGQASDNTLGGASATSFPGDALALERQLQTKQDLARREAW